MKINVPIKITAADSEARTISGRIVTFDEVANTSAGRTIFAKGSVKPTNVKLNLEHDRTRPIGKTLSMSETEDGSGIDAVFKIANTSAGTDAIEEAMAGLRDGFSVGVNVNEYDSQDGALVIKSSDLVEVSLVTEPAVKSAKVADVAASEGEEENSEGEKPAEETNPTTEGEQVEDTTVQAPAETESVEASRKVEAASRPAFYAKPRIEVTPAKYLENTIRASLGDEDARLYIAAADNTTDNAGLIPTRQLSEVINGVADGDRGFIDALSRGALPDAGMSFEIPKITVAPTVAQTNEEAAPSETDMNSAFVTVNVKKFAGQQTFSVELLDRSSPVFFNELLTQMAFAYAKATDNYAQDNAVTGSGDRTTIAGSTAANYLAYFATGATNVYKNSYGFARNIVVSPDQWGTIMGLNDAGRPIYTASQPMNAAGALSPQSLRGNVAGLDLYVSRSMSGTGQDTMAIINPQAFTWYESPTLRLQSNLLSTGQISVMYYGYGALAAKIAGGITFNGV